MIFLESGKMEMGVEAEAESGALVDASEGGNGVGDCDLSWNAQDELRALGWRDAAYHMYYPSPYNSNYFSSAPTYLPTYPTAAAAATHDSQLFLPQLFPPTAPPPPHALAPGPAAAAPYALGVHGAPPSPPRPQQPDDATSSTTTL